MVRFKMFEWKAYKGVFDVEARNGRRSEGEENKGKPWVPPGMATQVTKIEAPRALSSVATQMALIRGQVDRGGSVEDKIVISEVEAPGVDIEGNAPWALCTDKCVRGADVKALLVTGADGEAPLALGKTQLVTSADGEALGEMQLVKGADGEAPLVLGET
ncbi:unnamed protein product [Ilex paraguariensis]|uniref:Uncharacterized protein n=1 Tax=Ilex paraguariensis TaxID=185542 RepID=A0ABC8SRN7_9AQUA